MTQLRFLTDQELLQHVDKAAHQSPVIGELAKRLAAAVKPPTLQVLSCPVCLAKLDAQYCDTTETIEIEAKK